MTRRNARGIVATPLAPIRFWPIACPCSLFPLFTPRKSAHVDAPSENSPHIVDGAVWSGLLFSRWTTQNQSATPVAGSFHPSTNERSNDMYTRVVELTSKSGKAKELTNTINETALPILKKQRGFTDEIVLVSDTEPNRVLGISFWNSKKDAEQYHREQFPKIQDSVRHLLEGEPQVRTFNVHTYVGQKIVAEKAA
jgi:quinol monooxygenase YgiN